MSKAYIQLKQSIKIGDSNAIELAGDFVLMDDNITAETIAGQLVIPRFNLLCAVLLADDTDLATLGNDVHIVN